VNNREEIREAFRAHYAGALMGEEVDPARLYAVKGELDAAEKGPVVWRHLLR
jgi:type I restriction enzyme R subunit